MKRGERLVWNTIANTAGQLSGPVISLVLVPIYLAVLGHESYGLVGLLSSLTLLMQVFSQGIGQALQAEIAKRDVDDQRRRGLRRLVLTFERSYGVLGLVIACALLSLSGKLSHDWVRNEHLPSTTIHTCLILLSLRIGIAFPAGVYHSVFIGTQRQVLGNATSLAVTLTGACTTVAVVLAMRSVEWILIVDVVFAMISVTILRMQAFRILPPPSASEPGSFSREAFMDVARPSVWLITTSGIGVLIGQMDRLVLSRMVTLTDLAVYNAGAAAGRIVSLLYTPFLMASYPEVCQIAATGNRKELALVVARNATVVSAMTACCALPMCFFAPDVLEVWTRDAKVVEGGAVILVLYTIGSLAISNASVFFMMQMALGAVRYAAAFNALSLLWYPATMAAMVGMKGPAGAAWCWLAYGVSAWIAVAGMSFLRHLDARTFGSYAKSAGVPLLIGALFSAAMAAFAHHVFPSNPWVRIFIAGITAAAILPSSVIAVLGPKAGIGLVQRILGKRS